MNNFLQIFQEVSKKYFEKNIKISILDVIQIENNKIFFPENLDEFIINYFSNDVQNNIDKKTYLIWKKETNERLKIANITEKTREKIVQKQEIIKNLKILILQN
jgi:hypothetical protein